MDPLDGTTVTFNEHHSPYSSEDEDAYVITEILDENGLNLDMGMVSILKTHVTNPDIYELSHRGFLKKDMLKTKALKEIEQMRRFNKFKGEPDPSKIFSVVKKK